MTVFELMGWLAELPAGATVRIQPHVDSEECYEIECITDSTEDDTGSNVSVWINGNKRSGET